jgi:hypothetical protein
MWELTNGVTAKWLVLEIQSIFAASVISVIKGWTGLSRRKWPEDLFAEPGWIEP